MNFGHFMFSERTRVEMRCGNILGKIFLRAGNKWHMMGCLEKKFFSMKIDIFLQLFLLLAVYKFCGVCLNYHNLESLILNS